MALPPDPGQRVSRWHLMHPPESFSNDSTERVAHARSGSLCDYGDNGEHWVSPYDHDDRFTTILNGQGSIELGASLYDAIQQSIENGDMALTPDGHIIDLRGGPNGVPCPESGHACLGCPACCDGDEPMHENFERIGDRTGFIPAKRNGKNTRQ